MQPLCHKACNQPATTGFQGSDCAPRLARPSRARDATGDGWHPPELFADRAGTRVLKQSIRRVGSGLESGHRHWLALAGFGSLSLQTATGPSVVVGLWSYTSAPATVSLDEQLNLNTRTRGVAQPVGHAALRIAIAGRGRATMRRRGRLGRGVRIGDAGTPTQLARTYDLRERKRPSKWSPLRRSDCRGGGGGGCCRLTLFWGPGRNHVRARSRAQTGRATRVQVHRQTSPG